MKPDDDPHLYAGALVKSISIENLLQKRAVVLAEVARACAMLRNASAVAAAAGLGFPRFRVDEHRYDRGNLTDITDTEIENVTARIMDRAAWQHLLEESGLRTFMDAKARQQWNEAIDKGTFPDLTRENIAATFAQMHDTRAAMFERGVCEIFRALSWHYKTNRPFKFGKRLVLRGMRSQVSGGKWGFRSLGWPNDNTCSKLDDLERAFHVVEGVPEPDHREGWRSRLKYGDTLDTPIPESTYMTVRSFRNGNGHLTFKRPDLVEQLNRIIAKHHPDALPHDHAEAAT